MLTAFIRGQRLMCTCLKRDFPNMLRHVGRLVGKSPLYVEHHVHAGCRLKTGLKILFGDRWSMSKDIQDSADLDSADLRKINYYGAL